MSDKTDFQYDRQIQMSVCCMTFPTFI